MPYHPAAVELVEWRDDDFEMVRVRLSSSSCELWTERREPKTLPGRPVFCKLRGLDFVKSLSSELFESARLIGIGVEGPEEGISAVVGELEGLDEKNVAGRLFFLRTFPEPAGALSGGLSMGVNGEISGGKIERLFLRRFDMLGLAASSCQVLTHGTSLYTSYQSSISHRDG